MPVDINFSEDELVRLRMEAGHGVNDIFFRNIRTVSPLPFSAGSG